jgi:hypothetical protein
MADNFFDTSALGKRYHQELGSDKVDQLLADQSSRQLVSRLTSVEIHSVFAKKVRTGVLTLADFGCFPGATAATYGAGRSRSFA